jgi:hypothetical protein
MKAVVLIVAMIASNAQATIYNVDRTFTDGLSTVRLIGTLDIPIGSYTIQNAGPSPFTGVDLTLTVNTTDYRLNYALTGVIHGTGEFFIDATATTLTLLPMQMA